MDPKERLEMANDPRFIPGIYNYCDRWCERCAFTSRCLTYASSRRHTSAPDADNVEEVWDEVVESLQETLDLLHYIAEQEGIDLDAIDSENDMAERDRLKREAREHPLTVAAETYIGLVNDWFADREGKSQKVTSELDLLASLGQPDAGWEDRTEDLIDAFRIIHWYQFFIGAKVQRALHSRSTEALEPELWEEFPRDSDGSAKIALIAIDRSIGAWGKLLQAFPQRRLATVKLLAHLARLRADLEQEFPNAWAFMRPGFDEAEGPDQVD